MKFTLNKLAYNFHIRDTLELLINLSKKDLNRLHLIKREKIDDIITFINAIIKIHYDNNYKIINFREQSIIYFKLYYNCFIFNVNFKLFN